MIEKHNAQWVQNHYDAYSDKEWTRLIGEPEEEVR